MQIWNASSTFNSSPRKSQHSYPIYPSGRVKSYSNKKKDSSSKESKKDNWFFPKYSFNYYCIDKPSYIWRQQLNGLFFLRIPSEKWQRHLNPHFQQIHRWGTQKYKLNKYLSKFMDVGYLITWCIYFDNSRICIRSLPLLGIISPSLHICYQLCQFLRTSPHLLISPSLFQVALTQEADQQRLGNDRMYIR